MMRLMHVRWPHPPVLGHCRQQLKSLRHRWRHRWQHRWRSRRHRRRAQEAVQEAAQEAERKRQIEILAKERAAEAQAREAQETAMVCDNSFFRAMYI